MNHFKAILLTVFLSLVGRNVFAYDACIGGIYYNLDNESQTASVTYANNSSIYVTNKYIGTLQIPDEVYYNSIKYSVNSIGEQAFSNCQNLMSVTIPNSVVSIGSSAFWGCSKLSSITIPNSVTTIDDRAFENCNNMTSIVLSDNLTSIGYGLFKECTSLTAITIPEGVKTIGDYAFEGCNSLSSLAIPSSVNSIGSYAFSNCKSLSSITIPNSVTSIGGKAFSYCSGLISVSIPNSVTNIENETFYGCGGLTSIDLPESVVSIGRGAFQFCSGLTSITLPGNVSTIGYGAFANCSALTSVVVQCVPTNMDLAIFSYCTNLKNVVFDCESVTPLFKDVTTLEEVLITEKAISIGNVSFNGCSGLTSVTIPSSVTSIGNNAFRNCSRLVSVSIPGSVKEIPSYAFYGCSNLMSVTLPNSVTTIGEYAFWGCSQLTNIAIPNNVTLIGGYAFIRCSISSIILPDHLSNLGPDPFDESIKLYVNRNTLAMLAVWQTGYKPYLLDTEEVLEPPYLTVESTTQSTATIKVNNKDVNLDYYYYKNYEKQVLTGDEIVMTGLFPQETNSFYLYLALSGSNPEYNTYSVRTEYTTLPIKPSIHVESTASSVSVSVSYLEGDATVTSQQLVLNPSYVGKQKISGGTLLEGVTYFAKGLTPSSSELSFAYEITVSNGFQTKKYLTEKISAKTETLTLKTKQPKVVSLGNVIVSAEANVDDEEKNVGFEWRRTDWTDDFQSNTGTAIMVEGTMEGYIRNLNTEKLWKFRPYYLADNGTYYYGDWVGVDPTNTSFFEPTVHTYDKIVVNGNTALVKGYALGGSDDVTVQGFKYWKSAGGGSNRVSSADIPSGAKTVEASGTVMEVSLSDLDYDSSYSYVTFVTTSKGTYYGEIKTFETGKEPLILGDANGDMKVNVSDIVEIVNDILGKPSAKYNRNAADVNGDGQVNVTDIVNVVNIIMTSGSSASARRAASNNSLWLDGGTIRLRNAENYTATQFDINLSEGQSVGDISLSSTSNHQLTWQMVDENTCRVVVYSLSNTPFHTTEDVLFNITLNGSATISNELLIDADGSATAVERIQQDKPMDVYDLRGNKVRSNVTNLRGLAKGIYIINGKKVILQ